MGCLHWFSGVSCGKFLVDESAEKGVLTAVLVNIGLEEHVMDLEHGVLGVCHGF